MILILIISHQGASNCSADWASVAWLTRPTVHLVKGVWPRPIGDSLQSLNPSRRDIVNNVTLSSSMCSYRPQLSTYTRGPDLSLPWDSGWGWSGPDLRPSSNPQISPLNPKPPGGFLCGFACRLNGPLLGRSCNEQLIEDFAEWASCKASAADFYQLIECPPASAAALLHQFLVLSTFSLIGFLNMLFGTVGSSLIRCFEASEGMIMSINHNQKEWVQVSLSKQVIFFLQVTCK